MTDVATIVETHQIVVDEVFPHSPEVVWKTLTTPELMGRWLKMEPKDFEATEGRRFTYQTTPAGEWDGVIQCQVLDVVPNARLAYSWQGGREENLGYGSRLDTVVTFMLSPADGGTRIRMIHSGFVLPKNETAFKSMSQGWVKVIRTIDAISSEKH